MVIEPKLLCFEVNDTEFSENNADGYTSHMLKVILATAFLLPCFTLASTDTDAPVLNFRIVKCFLVRRKFGR